MDDNPLWQYSLAVYRLPAVREDCLSLQDRFAADVNVLLCACWLASRGHCWSTGQLAQVVELSERFRSEYLLSVRRLRRSLKHAAPIAVYEQAKRLELAMERWQQDRLWEYWRTEGPPEGDEAFPRAALINCRRYFDYRGAEPSEERDVLLQQLIAAVELCRGREPGAGSRGK